MPLLFALVLLLATSLAQATVYKCATDAGVLYQDVPCAIGKELRNLDANPPNLSVVPAAPAPSGSTPTRPQKTLAAVSSDRRATRSAPKGGSAAERKFVRVGMTEGEVVHRLGRPDVESSGRGRRGREWSYLPADGDADTLTTFTFAGGKVVNVERRITR